MDSSPAPPSRRHAFSLRLFAVELLVYAVFVTVYFLLVLHFLGDWLNGLFHDHRKTYAFAACGLIAAQSVVLDAVTRALLRFLRGRLEGRDEG